MAWLQLEFTVPAKEIEVLEDTLLEHGAAAITLLGDPEDLDPIVEPNPGETPLWEVVRLRALFSLDAELKAIRNALNELPAELQSWDLQFIGDQDWQDKARTFAVDRVFADRLRVRPPPAADEPPDELGKMSAELATLYLEPGLAFGSGSHPTTQLCLTWLAENVQSDQRVLDFGCGSGILAIAAAMLGASVFAVDHDPQAVVASEENARRNGIRLGDAFNVQHSDRFNVGDGLQFDILVANILAGPLEALAPTLEASVQIGGHIVLSGVLKDQAQQVMAAYKKTEFIEPRLEQDWALLVGIRGE